MPFDMRFRVKGRMYVLERDIVGEGVHARNISSYNLERERGPEGRARGDVVTGKFREVASIRGWSWIAEGWGDSIIIERSRFQQ